MTTLNAELYDALIAIKVPEKKARAAAATIPASEQIVTHTTLSELKQDIGQLKTDMRTLKWIVGALVGTHIALLVGLLVTFLTQ